MRRPINGFAGAGYGSTTPSMQQVRYFQGKIYLFAAFTLGRVKEQADRRR